MLKVIVKNRLGSDVHDKVLGSNSSNGDSTNTQSLTAAALDAVGTDPSTKQAASILQDADFGLMAAIQAAQRSFVITDPSIPDNPIIFASRGFLELSGYTLEQVLGRNCRFMQGPGSDAAQVEALRKGIQEGVDTSVCILNYRADGTPFYNQIFVAALRDVNNKIINYVGVQVEVSNVHSSQYLNRRSKPVESV
jgi:PAS domain S-box-containing protein